MINVRGDKQMNKKLGKCKECGCDLCKESIRPDGSCFIGCSNCSYVIEVSE